VKIHYYNYYNFYEDIASIVLFVPGGTDNKDIKIENNNLINLDNDNFLFESKGKKNRVPWT